MSPDPFDSPVDRDQHLATVLDQLFFRDFAADLRGVHQKRALLTSIHVAEDVCAPVAYRQVVLTIPKRLRLHSRFDRTLPGKLCACVWTCLQAEVRRMLGRDDVVPGMVAAIQAFDELLHWQPWQSA